MHDSILDDIWSRAKYYTSYTDYLTANPAIQPTNDDSDVAYKPKHQFNIFSITHNNNTVANVQLCTSPLVMGDIIQIVADFSDVFYKCDQVEALFDSDWLDGDSIVHGRICSLLERPVGEVLSGDVKYCDHERFEEVSIFV